MKIAFVVLAIALAVVAVPRVICPPPRPAPCLDESTPTCIQVPGTCDYACSCPDTQLDAGGPPPPQTE